MKNKINDICYFEEIWDGNYDGNELLNSGSISLNEKDIIEFKIIKKNDDILKTIVQITDIF